ncbi:unnamed protein product [Closterium sp. Naga37s-1]|nr:unnamed protein product [Closterium sp. Naga37s-1]
MAHENGSASSSHAGSTPPSTALSPSGAASERASPLERQIRASFTDSAVRVYQAYSHTIAAPAAETKDQSDASTNEARTSNNDTHHHAIKGTRPDSNNRRNASQVVVQWDPERDLLLNRLNYRSIQIGLRGDVAAAYARGEYIERIADVTELFREVHRLGVREGRVEEAARLLPAEAEFPVAPAVRSALRMDAPLAGEAAAS